MVLRCCWGTCKADERYPARLKGGKFILFPKPKRNLQKCMKWIKNCGRKHEVLNVNRINKHKAVCSVHFVGGNGPSELWPDPIPADGSPPVSARIPVKRRITFEEFPSNTSAKKLKTHSPSNADKDKGKTVAMESAPNIIDICSEAGSSVSIPHSVDVGTQTEDKWVSNLDVLSMAAEISELRSQVQELQQQNQKLTSDTAEMKRNNFGVEKVKQCSVKMKDIFKFYTAITFVRFCSLLAFLTSCEKIEYEKGRRDILSLSYEDGLFLTLCRFRHNFMLKDLAVRFGISVQSASCVVRAWTERMYFKFGQLNIWPHRDVIIDKMPAKFKADFPNTLIIIDGTELRTQSPCALPLQSQLYSDYKSSTTLKCLIGCDPRGSLLFVSELFTGSVSDKEITEKSGFYEILKTMKAHNYIKDKDAIMADKGFTIKTEIEKLGLSLNLPPFASSGMQMSTADNKMTSKIAKHRVHIERLIKKVKTYKIVSDKIPTSLFHSINQIWTVCCYLTLFQDVFIKDD